MPIVNGVYTPLTFEDALEDIINAAPASIQFAPGNPPELILANMFAQANVLIDADAGAVIAALMSPTGANIDLQNPNNPRRAANPTIGYVLVSNPTGGNIVIAPGTVFTASSGQKYTLGVTSVTVPAAIDEYTPGTAECVVTAEEAGIGGNIPAGRTFTIEGQSSLSGVNPLPWLDGYDAETDARYWTRVIQDKTEYGAQPNSVNAEIEMRKYYSAAKIRVNRSQVAATGPVPVPGNGYNMVVRTPNGPAASALESQKAFEILAKRFEFVNSQNVGDERHVVMSGTVYKSGIPQAFYYTAAQPVDVTVNAVILVRFAAGTAYEEKVSQSNDFASYFIKRLMAFLSGVDGSSVITFEPADVGEATAETSIPFSGNLGETDPIAPVFSIGSVRDLVSDAATRAATPQLFYDDMESLEIILDPGVEYESAVVMSLEEYGRKFINFYADGDLFSDGTSWFDRFIALNPGQINVTVKEVV